MAMNAHSRRAVVTGHSRGLGAAIAAELLSRDVPVLGVSRHDNAALRGRFGDQLEEVRLDLSDPVSITRWIEDGALERFVGDATRPMLVNNAGVLEPVGALETQDVSDVARAVAVNVGAALMLSVAFVRATDASADRRILQISSGAGRKAYAGWSVYCATKAALDHHARCVALDRTPGLRVSSVAPGVINTEMQAVIRSSTDEQFPDRPRFVAMHREGKLRGAEEVARAVTGLLLSEEFGMEAVTEIRY